MSDFIKWQTQGFFKKTSNFQEKNVNTSDEFFYFLKLLCLPIVLNSQQLHIPHYVIFSYLACTSEEELPNLTKIVFEKKRWFEYI